MIRIGLSGIPGSGKTTSTRAISSKLKNVEVVSEYARRYISKHGNINSIYEQFRILQKQLDWENSVTNDKLKYLITDSPIFLGFIYCSELPKRDSKEIMFFIDTFKQLVKLNFPIPRYDLIIHLNPSKSPVNDGIRAEHQFNSEWRNKTNNLILSTYNIFPPKKLVIIDKYDIDEIVEKSLEIIKEIESGEE